jgi:hypothetical protein
MRKVKHRGYNEAEQRTSYAAPTVLAGHRRRRQYHGGEEKTKTKTQGCIGHPWRCIDALPFILILPSLRCFLFVCLCVCSAAVRAPLMPRWICARAPPQHAQALCRKKRLPTRQRCEFACPLTSSVIVCSKSLNSVWCKESPVKVVKAHDDAKPEKTKKKQQSSEDINALHESRCPLHLSVRADAEDVAHQVTVVHVIYLLRQDETARRRSTIALTPHPAAAFCAAANVVVVGVRRRPAQSPARSPP